MRLLFQRSVLCALLLSLILHGIIWAGWQHRESEAEPSIPPEIIEVALVTVARPQAEPQPAPTQPPPPQVERKPEPKPPQKVDKPLPKPKLKPKPKPTPQLNSLPTPTPPADPDSAPKPPASAPAETVAPPGPPKPVAPAPVAVTEASYRAPGLNNPPTRYPRLALERQWEGTVVLRVQVGADGTPGDIRIERSSGHELLDEATVEQVSQWRFMPARRGDQPVASAVIVPIEYKLKR